MGIINEKKKFKKSKKGLYLIRESLQVSWHVSAKTWDEKG